MNALAKNEMQALQQRGYGGIEVFAMDSVARPTAGEGEVVIQVSGAGVDRGTWHLMTGRPYLMRMMGFGFSGPKQSTPGLDVSGTVVEVGAGVTRFQLGDRVFGIAMGSFAQFARAREDKLAKVPQGFSLQDAALLGVSGLTALQALTEVAKVQRGERVLVLGASGGVGTYAVQIAKALGAEVHGVCSAAKAELVRSLGASKVIDYRAADALSGDTRYDVILDIGGNRPVSELRRAMAETGRLVFVGNEQGGDFTAGFGRVLWALAMGPFVKQRFLPFAAKEHFAGLEQIARFVEAGSLKPVVDRRVSLAEVPAALSELERGTVRGKVLVTVA